MNTVNLNEGVAVQLHYFLSSSVDTDEWSVSRLGRFNFRVIVTGTCWTGGLVGCKVGLEVLVRGKCANRKWGPESPSP